LGTVAVAVASVPSDVKDMIAGPEDFVTPSVSVSAFDRASYRPLSIDAAESVQAVPVYWASESHGPFQPAAMMFRVNEDRTEYLTILDSARRVVRHFPVTAGSLSGEYPPLMGNSSPRLLDDGTYIVHSHGSDGLYRKDLCGNVIWSVPGLYHHSFSVVDGKLGILGLPKDNVTDAEREFWNSSDILNVIDIETGKVERSVKLEDIARANIDKFDPLMWRTWHKLTNPDGVLSEDLIHLNKLEILSQRFADDYADFPAGAWLLSSRQLNLIFVVDPETLRILWYSHGNTQGQHDPDFVGENRIIVFNNSLSENVDPPEHPLNFSSIKAYDFSRASWSELYNAAAVNGYTAHSGEVESGLDGRLLVTLTAQGRYLEVSSSGELLSEFINTRDSDSVYWTKSAQYLTDSQFEIARSITCQSESQPLS
jgi:hypothetical protein